MFRILAISTGSTSTKVGVFEDDVAKASVTVRHEASDLAKFQNVIDQYVMRKEQVTEALCRNGFDVGALNAVASIGGPLNPLPGGVYRVSEKMVSDIRSGNVYMQHASHLGALVSREIERISGIPAFIVDPVTTDEFMPIARVSGFDRVPRTSATHALNAKAVARRVASSMGKPFGSLSFVVAHIGGGSSVSALRHGRIIDSVTSRQDGPFSAEAAGGLSMPDFFDFVASGAMDPKSIKALWFGSGGLVSHLGTNSIEEVQRRIEAGDTKAEMVLSAMAYSMAKGIGAMASALGERPCGIILTGGGAYSARITTWIKERVCFIAPVFTVPGEDELAALAEGVLRVLRGEEEALEY